MGLLLVGVAGVPLHYPRTVSYLNELRLNPSTPTLTSSSAYLSSHPPSSQTPSSKFPEIHKWPAQEYKK